MSSLDGFRNDPFLLGLGKNIRGAGGLLSCYVLADFVMTIPDLNFAELLTQQDTTVIFSLDVTPLKIALSFLFPTWNVIDNKYCFFVNPDYSTLFDAFEDHSFVHGCEIQSFLSLLQQKQSALNSLTPVMDICRWFSLNALDLEPFSNRYL